jgi:DNA-directed RNA polymerase subunit alpha
MLQIKQLRMKLYDVDSARVTLDIKGEGTITAADIICPPEVEIVNPELYLFTVDDKNAHIEMTLTVEHGRGYLPAGERSERLPIGDLPVDAIFTPVKRVNWSVENARVGQSTNYDKLVMEIWTDGTLSPEKAMIDAAHILIKHLSYIAGVSEEMFVAPVPVVEVVSHISSETAEMPIENLDLTVRVFNSLKRTGITTVGDVIELLEKGDEAVLSIRNFGDKSLVELKAKMIEKGYIEQEIVE